MSNAPQINTESDYQAAIAELEQLWGAKIGTAEATGMLATLIDAYEAADAAAFGVDLAQHDEHFVGHDVPHLARKLQVVAPKMGACY